MDGQLDSTPFRRRRPAAHRPCDHPTCEAEGVHRAPRGRDRLEEFFWFCKEHAREYNAAWNFCAGMSTADVDRMVRDAAVWDRPTWPMGLRFGTARTRAGVHDSTDFFDEEGAFKSGDEETDFRRRARRRAEEGPESHAMRVLGLVAPVTLTGLKRRYKELAKELHPDLGGSARGEEERRAAEDRLKDINHAYGVLRRSLEESGRRA
ncbi:J domain-containing protein [Marivibrio halodurans]|uniref:J domain-containing protein n=1 Tax=Marivibrio halodurans TaxID=2039722 RepID=A0A8J7S5A6_9PROT|nr:J domain-containing protein [Marivibrio halodurans]MBP5859064.1 J domain-containing protein [Marivibrio halodurans]